MDEEALDELYTLTCRSMTALGEVHTQLFLARLCLLLMQELDDPERARRAIEAAAAQMHTG